MYLQNIVTPSNENDTRRAYMLFLVILLSKYCATKAEVIFAEADV